MLRMLGLGRGFLLLLSRLEEGRGKGYVYILDRGVL
jgi:hypothetical protein